MRYTRHVPRWRLARRDAYVRSCVQYKGRGPANRGGTLPCERRQDSNMPPHQARPRWTKACISSSSLRRSSTSRLTRSLRSSRVGTSSRKPARKSEIVPYVLATLSHSNLCSLPRKARPANAFLLASQSPSVRRVLRASTAPYLSIRSRFSSSSATGRTILGTRRGKSCRNARGRSGTWTRPSVRRRVSPSGGAGRRRGGRRSGQAAYQSV